MNGEKFAWIICNLQVVVSVHPDMYSYKVTILYASGGTPGYEQFFSDTLMYL